MTFEQFIYQGWQNLTISVACLAVIIYVLYRSGGFGKSRTIILPLALITLSFVSKLVFLIWSRSDAGLAWIDRSYYGKPALSVELVFNSIFLLQILLLVSGLFLLTRVAMGLSTAKGQQ